MKTSAEEIENRIAEIDPEEEFLAVENAGGDALRIYIDYPGGVSLETCQKVTGGLAELLEKHTLEVSSPGPRRPLTKPAHFARFDDNNPLPAKIPLKLINNFMCLTGHITLKLFSQLLR